MNKIVPLANFYNNFIIGHDYGVKLYFIFFFIFSYYV